MEHQLQDTMGLRQHAIEFEAQAMIEKLKSGGYRPTNDGHSLMKSWTISRRISTGGILVLTTLAAVVTVSLFGLHTLNLRIKSLRDHVLPGVTAIGLANGHFMSCYSSLLVAREIRDNATRLKVLDNADQHLAHAKSELAHYSAGVEDPADHANFEELSRRLEAYLKVRAEYCALLRRGELEAAGPFVAERLEPANATLREYFDTMLSWNAGEGRTETEEMSSVSKRMLSIEVALAAAGFALCIGAGLLIVRGVKRALAKISGGLSDATLQISAAAGQIAAASETLAQGASEQAASLEETSASLEEMSSMTRQNSDSSRQAKELSAENRTSADRGATQMDQMRAAMSEIKASSHDIAKIIKTIDEIAFQTNILALNAAVEAARAGDAGMGFAVVAEEVRALAQRSAQSARETAAKIEDAISKSDHGVGISESVASVLHEIVEKTRRVDDFVASIATASHEQSDGVSQLNKAVNQMDKVTQANAGSAEETASAAQGLTSQVDTLSAAVADLQELVGLSANANSRAAKITPAAPPKSSSRATRPHRGASSRREALRPVEN